tara:strand:- start:659 stop:1318 length:660 start_codon:yes stop_codon:yes gene_type:complete
MISVAILEDNVILQDRLSTILQGWDYVNAVYSLTTNSELLECISKHEVDVLLADLSLPDGDGKESIKAFADTNPNGISIVISAKSDSESILLAIKAGAIGYLHKDDYSFEIIGAIKLALQGESPISSAIAHKIFKSMQSEAFAADNDVGQFSPTTGILTPREVEVLFTISKGLSYAEAATTLNISRQTLPVHIRSIYRKLQSNNRAEAIYEARLLGILE